MKELLKKLCEMHGAPGYEDEIADFMMEEFKKSCDKVERDRMDNVIAKKGEGKPIYMLTAHMDEIGFVVKYIDEKGFIWFVTIGGFYEPTISNRRVIIHTSKGKIFGVTGMKPPHIMEEEEKKKAVVAKEMFIDVGAKNKKEVINLGIKIGDPITFDQKYEFLHDNKVTAKAIDDRAGCVVLIELMKRLKKFKGTVYAVATVQEEVGLKGAQVAAFKLKPDIGIAIDVCIPGDHPGIEEKHSPIKLGGGPIIEYIEASGKGLIADPKINKWLEETANKYKIPFQTYVGSAGMTDAAIIYISQEGVPSTSIGIPARYIHSPVEVASLDDIENTIKLLVAALEEGYV
ncbi:MAG: M42 family metallopeptidase [Candidatus Parvarchaeota archaeon]|nr:M42 family metallopeptidase [Candidatus Jingweiarchaeum tengchongense]MCW1298009.1 M42 family metallopeptidase [Candidatus Jingweiarchaeum tengchongense]MCW1300190.1 M42 family metallopeptidase [Candidatus Jingweiarchaeum tengchongense]MCW1304400.1 M42 family metallopeptidase [Candidatus Jingweiarchaeum tengchongense]MCW1305951.1 M42 family metallopeptidase [Candidatus Jingweiarchaeum tengchongense]